jgi:hypothetical protein
VSGPYDRLTFGRVTIVRPRTPAPGAAPVGFAIPNLAAWRFLGRSRDDYRMVNVTADRKTLSRAADATILVLGCWPSLREHVALADPSPALAVALWDLTGVLLERERVRESCARLSDVGRESFARRQKALDEARAVLRSADYLMVTGDHTRPVDPAADLADHTTAVLAAYRELTS